MALFATRDVPRSQSACSGSASSPSSPRTSRRVTLRALSGLLVCFALLLCFTGGAVAASASTTTVQTAEEAVASSAWFTAPAHVPPRAPTRPSPGGVLKREHDVGTGDGTISSSSASLTASSTVAYNSSGEASSIETLASVLSIEPSGYIGFGEMRSPLTIVGLFLASITNVYVDGVKVFFTVESQYALTILSLPAHPSPPSSIFCFTDAVGSFRTPLGTISNTSSVIDSSRYQRCEPTIRPVQITITTAQRNGTTVTDTGVLLPDNSSTILSFNWTTVLDGQSKVPLLARHSGYTSVLLGIANTVQVMQRREAYLPVETLKSPTELWRSTVMAMDDTERYSTALKTSSYYLSTPRELATAAALNPVVGYDDKMVVDKYADWRLTTRLTVRHSHSVDVGDELQETEAELMRFNARIGYMTFSPVRMFTMSQYVQEELLRQAAAATTKTARDGSTAAAEGTASLKLPEMLWHMYNTMHAQVRVTLKEGFASNTTLQWSVGQVIGCDAISTVTASIPYPHNRYGLHHVLPTMDEEAQLLAVPATHYVSSQGLRTVNTTTLMTASGAPWIPFGTPENDAHPPYRLAADGARQYYKPGTRSRSSDVRRTAFYHRLQLFGAFSRTVPYTPGRDVLPEGDVGERMEVDIRLHRLTSPSWLTAWQKQNTTRTRTAGDAGNSMNSTTSRVALRLEEENAGGVAPCFVVTSDAESYTCEAGIVPYVVDMNAIPTDTTIENNPTEEAAAAQDAHRALDSCGAGTVAHVFWSNQTNSSTGDRQWNLVHPFPVALNDNSLYMIRDVLQRYPAAAARLVNFTTNAAATTEAEGGSEGEASGSAPGLTPVAPLLRFTFSFVLENTYNGSYRLHCYGNAGHGVVVDALYQTLGDVEEKTADARTSTTTVVRASSELCRLHGPDEDTNKDDSEAKAEEGEAVFSDTTTTTADSSAPLWLHSAVSTSNLALHGSALLNITCTFSAADLANASLLQGAYCGVSLEALKVVKASFLPAVQPHGGVPWVGAEPDTAESGAATNTATVVDADAAQQDELYGALVVELVAPIEPGLGGRPVDANPPASHQLQIRFIQASPFTPASAEDSASCTAQTPSRCTEDDGETEFGPEAGANDFVLDIPRPRSVEECLYLKRDLYFSHANNETGPRWSFLSGIPSRRPRTDTADGSNTGEASNSSTSSSISDYQCTWYVATVLDAVTSCDHVEVNVLVIPSATASSPTATRVLSTPPSPVAKPVYCGSRSYFLDPLTALQTRVPLDTIPSLVDLAQLTEPLMHPGQGSTADVIDELGRRIVSDGIYQFCVDVRFWSSRSKLILSAANPMGPLLYHLYDINSAAQFDEAVPMAEGDDTVASYTFDPAVTRIYNVEYPLYVEDGTLFIEDKSASLTPQPPSADFNDSVYFSGSSFIFAHAQTQASLFSSDVQVYLTINNRLSHTESVTPHRDVELAPLQGVILNSTHVLLSILETLPGGWHAVSLASGDFGPLRNATGQPLSLVIRSTVTSVNAPDVSGLCGGSTIVVRGSNFPVYEIDRDLFHITLGRLQDEFEDEEASRATTGEATPMAPTCTITSSTTTQFTCVVPPLTEEWVRTNAYGVDENTGHYRVPIIISVYYRDEDGARQLLQRITTRAPAALTTSSTSTSAPSETEPTTRVSTVGTTTDTIWLYVPIRLSSTVVSRITPTVVSAQAPSTVFVISGENIVMSSLLLCMVPEGAEAAEETASLSCEICLPGGQSEEASSMSCTVNNQMRIGTYDVRVAREPHTTLALTVKSEGPSVTSVRPSVVYPYGEHTLTYTGTGFYCSELITAVVRLQSTDLRVSGYSAATVLNCEPTVLSVSVSGLSTVVAANGGLLTLAGGAAACTTQACVVRVLSDDEIPRITSFEPMSGQAPLIITIYGTGFTKLPYSPLQKTPNGITGDAYIDVGYGRCELVDVLNTVLLCNMSNVCSSNDGEQPMQLVSHTYGRTRDGFADIDLRFQCSMTVQHISVPRGSLFGGQDLTITGVGFPTDSSVLEVTVAGVACAVMRVATNTINCVTGAAIHSMTGVVRVFNNATKAVSTCCEYAYDYGISPTITSITPNIAIRGSYVTVRGTGFLGSLESALGGILDTDAFAHVDNTHEAGAVATSARQSTTSPLPLASAATAAVRLVFGQESIYVTPTSDTTLEFTVTDSYGMDTLTVYVPGLGKSLPSPGSLTVSMTPAIVQPSSGGFFGKRVITLVGTAVEVSTTIEALSRRLEVWVCGRLCTLTTTSKSNEIRCVVPEYWDVEIVNKYVSYLSFSQITSGFTEYYQRTSFANSAAAYQADLEASNKDEVSLWNTATLFKSGAAGASSAVVNSIYYLFEANPHSRLLIYEIFFALRPLSGNPLDLSGSGCELLIPTDQAMASDFDFDLFDDPLDAMVWNASARHPWPPLAVGVNTLSFADGGSFPVSPHFGFYCTGIPPNAVVVESAGINGYQVGLRDSGGECPVDMVSVPGEGSTLPSIHSCSSRTGVACAMYQYDIALTPVVTNFFPLYVASSRIGETVTLSGVGFGDNITAISNIVLDNVLFTPVRVTDTELVCRLVGDVLSEDATLVQWDGGSGLRGTALILSQQSFYTPVSWSSLLAWGGASPPARGESRTLAAGLSVLLDTSPPFLESLTVRGTLIVADGYDIDLTASQVNIVDGGALFAGNAAAPRTRRFRITLDLIDAEDASSAYNSENERQFPVQKRLLVENGALQLYGATAETCIALLASTASIGSTRITLSTRVRWNVGDTISLTSTSFSAKEEETRTIVHRSFDGPNTILAVDRPLDYEHKIYATNEIQSNFRSALSNVSTYIAGRAVLLSRTVQVEGGSVSALSYTGGILRLETSLSLTLSGVGFYRMGQLGTVNGFGIWFRDVHYTSPQVVMDHVAVQEAYFRGVVLSNSQHLTISNNTFHRVEGYGVAAIGALHRSLSLLDNLIHGTSAYRGGSDPTPGGMLFTYPTATIQGNRISVSEGNGVWYALRQTYAGANSRTCPSEAPLGTFRWNTIMNVRRHGLLIFPMQFATATTCASNLFAISNDDTNMADSTNEDDSADDSYDGTIEGDGGATEDDVAYEATAGISNGVVNGIVNGTPVVAGVLERNQIISCGLHGLYLPPSSGYQLRNMIISDCVGAAIYADFSTNVTSIEGGLLTDTSPSGTRTNFTERTPEKQAPLNTDWDHLTLNPPGADDPPAVFAAPCGLHVRHGGFLTMFDTTLGSYKSAYHAILLALPRVSHVIYAQTTMAYYVFLESAGISKWASPSPSVVFGGQVAAHDHDGTLVISRGDAYVLSGASYLERASWACGAYTSSSLRVASVNEARLFTLTQCTAPAKRLGIFSMTADNLGYKCDPRVSGCNEVTVNISTTKGSYELTMVYPNDGFVASGLSVLPTFFHFIEDFDLSLISPSTQALANGMVSSQDIKFYSDNLTYSFAYVNVTEDGQLVRQPSYPSAVGVTYFTLESYFQVSSTFFFEVSPRAYYIDGNALFLTAMTAAYNVTAGQDQHDHNISSSSSDDDDNTEEKPHGDSESDSQAVEGSTTRRTRRALEAPPRVRRFAVLREFNVTNANHDDVTNRSWAGVRVVNCPPDARCMTPSYPYLRPTGRTTPEELAIALQMPLDDVQVESNDYDFFDAEAWLNARPPSQLYDRGAGDTRIFTIPAGHRVTLQGRNVTIDGVLVVMGELIIRAAPVATSTNDDVLILRCESIAVFGKLRVAATHETSQRVDIRLGYMAPMGSTYDEIEAEMASGMTAFESNPLDYTCYRRARAVRLSTAFRLYCGTLLVVGEASLEGWTGSPTTWRAQSLITTSSPRTLPPMSALADVWNAYIFANATFASLVRRLPHWYHFPYGTNTSAVYDYDTYADIIGSAWHSIAQSETLDNTYRGTALRKGQWLTAASSSQSLDEAEVTHLTADVMMTQIFTALTDGNTVTRRAKAVTDSGFVSPEWEFDHGVSHIISSGNHAAEKGDEDEEEDNMEAAASDGGSRDDESIHTDNGKIYSEVVFLSKKIELNCLIPEAAVNLGCQVMVRHHLEPAQMFTRPNFTCHGTLIRHFGKFAMDRSEDAMSAKADAESRGVAQSEELYFMPAVFINSTGEKGVSLGGSVLYESFATAIYVSPYAQNVWLVDSGVISSYGGGVRVDASSGLFMCGVVAMGTRYARDDVTTSATVPVLTTSSTPFDTLASLQSRDVIGVKSLCSFLVNYTVDNSTTTLLNSVAAGSESEGFCLQWDMGSSGLTAHSNAIGVFLFSHVRYQTPEELAADLAANGGGSNVTTGTDEGLSAPNRECGGSTICTQSFVSTALRSEPMLPSQAATPHMDVLTPRIIVFSRLLSYMNRFIGVYSSAVDSIEFSEAHIIANPIGMAVSVSPLFGDGLILITNSFLSTAPVCQSGMKLECAPSPLFPSTGVGCGPVALVDTTYNYTNILVTSSYQQRGLDYDRAIPVTAVTTNSYEMDVSSYIQISNTELGGVGVYECAAQQAGVGGSSVTSPAHIQRGAGIMGNMGVISSSSIYMITSSGITFSEVSQSLTTYANAYKSAAVLQPSGRADAPAPQFTGPEVLLPDSLRCGKSSCFPFRSTVLRDQDGSFLGAAGKFLSADGSMEGMCTVHPLAPDFMWCPANELQQLVLRSLDDRADVLTGVNYSFTLQITTTTSGRESTEEVSESVMGFVTTQAPDFWYATPDNASATSNTLIKKTIPFTSLHLDIPVDSYPDVFQVSTSDCSMIPADTAVIISLDILDVQKAISVWDVKTGQRATRTTALPPDLKISLAQIATGVASWNVESAFDAETGAESMRLNLIMSCGKTLEVHQQVFGLVTLYTPQPPSRAEHSTNFLQSRVPANVSESFPGAVVCVEGLVGLRIITVSPNPYSTNDAFLTVRVEWMDHLGYNATEATEGINAFLDRFAEHEGGLTSSADILASRPTGMPSSSSADMTQSTLTNQSGGDAQEAGADVEATPLFASEDKLRCNTYAVNGTTGNKAQGFRVFNSTYLVTARVRAYTPAEFAASQREMLRATGFFVWRSGRLAAFVVVVACLLLLGIAVRLGRRALKRGFLAHFAASEADCVLSGTAHVRRDASDLTRAPEATITSLWRHSVDQSRQPPQGVPLLHGDGGPNDDADLALGDEVGMRRARRSTIGLGPDTTIRPSATASAEGARRSQLGSSSVSGGDAHAAAAAAATRAAVREFESDVKSMEQLDAKEFEESKGPLVAFELGSAAVPRSASNLALESVSDNTRSRTPSRDRRRRRGTGAVSSVLFASSLTSTSRLGPARHPATVGAAQDDSVAVQDRHDGGTAVSMQRLPDTLEIPTEATNPDSGESARKDYYVQLWRVAPNVTDALERQTRSRSMPPWGTLRMSRALTTPEKLGSRNTPRFLNRPPTTAGVHAGGLGTPFSAARPVGTIAKASLRTEALFAPPFAQRPRSNTHDDNFIAVGVSRPDDVDVTAEAEDASKGSAAVVSSTSETAANTNSTACLSTEAPGSLSIKPILMVRPVGAVGSAVPVRETPGRPANLRVPVYTSPLGDISGATSGQSMGGDTSSPAPPFSLTGQPLPRPSPPPPQYQPAEDVFVVEGENVVTVRGRGQISFATTSEQASNSERALRSRSAPYWSKY